MARADGGIKQKFFIAGVKLLRTFRRPSIVKIYHFLLCLLLVACAAPSPDFVNGSERTSTTPGAVQSSGDLQTTPVGPGATPDTLGGNIVRLGDEPREFLPPSIEPSIPLPPPADVISLPEGTVNVMLLGSDQRGDGKGFRTDTLMFVSFHPQGDRINVVSIPRDSYVYIPGWSVRRINSAYQFGGLESLADTMDYNFGVRPDYFLLVNFDTFKQAIDNLEGIDVKVSAALEEGDYAVEPGTVHMDGEMALWYVRSRYTTSDFERMTRQQEVMMAIFHRLISADALNKVPQLYGLYKDSVVTNIGLGEVLGWVGIARQLADEADILHTLTLNRDYVTSYKTSSGAQVLLPNRDLIWQTLSDLLGK
ncbi:MAG: LCP family protein [Anaerolineae bacterium]|nr:LCP family protein [Anaerolineae bacterium]